MEFLAEFVASAVGGILLPILLYPFGLLRLWIVGKPKKSFIKIIQEKSFLEIGQQGSVFMLDLVAAAGALGLTVMLVLAIGATIWSIIKALIF